MRRYYARMATSLHRAALTALLLSACGSPAPDALDSGLGAGDAGPDDDAGCDVDADPLACEDLSPNPACAARYVVGLRGQIEELDGTPIEGARPQLCARVSPDDNLVCLVPPMSEADGRFTIVVPEEVRCLARGALRMIAPGRSLATTYCPLELPGAATVVELGEAFALQPVRPAIALPTRGEGSQPREVSFEGGLTLTLAPDDLSLSDAYEALEGAPVPVDPAPCFAQGQALDGLVAFRPEVDIAGGAALRIPNDAGLAPGAVVDLFVLGGLETQLLDGTDIEEAELVRFGSATVDSAGEAIVSDAGSELPYLSWLGWAAR